MQRSMILLAAAAGLAATQAQASDKPAIGPVPAWVKPVGMPPEPAKPPEGALGLLLSDQQLALEPGHTTSYSDVALKIQTPQGLQAGNISFSWRPDTDEPTVHKLVIHRGAQTIDVLGSGQTFTVVRREPNLESATLDGVLTANIQPEGLQVGDIIEFALSIHSSDPVMRGHVEGLAAGWNGAPVGRAHLRIQWPTSLPVRLRQTAGLPALVPAAGPGGSSAELSLDDLKPIVPPKGAPTRYALTRLVEATDFKSWAEVGALMAPLFAKASVVPAQGPLRAELEKIRALSPDPRLRAETALALVQERVRYVALMMGQGGLTPADAETTWSRRYGDCKAKTALLLALLHELGIQADPVAVNTTTGDGMDARLPMIGLFDHVLVRATIGGRVYWLDGARTGDGSLDRLTTPNYGWGLPLTATGATLVRMLPPPLDAPNETLSIRLDASAGISQPAPAHTELVLSRDDAVGMKVAMEALDAEARDRTLKAFWRAQYDFIDISSVAADFDAKTGEERLTMDGVAHMDWSAGYYQTDGMSVGYKPDFVRDPTSDQDAPYATTYPTFERTIETIVLPPNFGVTPDSIKAYLDQTVAGMEYHRHGRLQGDTLVIEKTERSIAPEFPAKDAPAAAIVLRQLADKTIAINKPAVYVPTPQEVQASMATTPTTAAEYLARANLLVDRNRPDDAIADYDHAIAMDPKSAAALAGRGLAHVLKGDDAAAEKDLAAAGALDPRNLIIAHARGLMAERKGQPAAAAAAYTAALAINPADTFALGRRAGDEYSARDFDAALADTAAALKANPRWFEMKLLRASIFHSQGKADEALAEASAAADGNPDNPYAQVAAGNLLSTLGKTDQAMQAYDRALKIKPEAYVYVNRAQNRPKSDVAGRRADLDAALALDPKLMAALWDKGELLRDQGDLAGAIALYSKALDASPGSLNLLLGRGIAYAKAGDRAHADTDFDTARTRATEPGQLNALCWSKATEGVALESALADCDAALAKSPDNAAFIDSRAFVMLRLGRLDESIADYSRAIRAAPRQADSLFGRGVAWSRKGDKIQSAADIAAALKIDPDVRKHFETYGVLP